MLILVSRTVSITTTNEAKFCSFSTSNVIFKKQSLPDLLTYDWENDDPDADAVRLAELAQDYATLVACPAPSRENILDGNASHTNINASSLAIRSWLAHYSPCVCNGRAAKSSHSMYLHAR